MAKTKWLDRPVIVAPHLALCGSEKEYLAAVKHLKVTDPTKWLTSSFSGMTHTFTKDDSITCIVTIDFKTCKDFTLSEIVGILAHEATHVCQQLYDNIGESKPSTELEAYAIQCTTQRLVAEFLRRKVKYKKEY